VSTLYGKLGCSRRRQAESVPAPLLPAEIVVGVLPRGLSEHRLIQVRERRGRMRQELRASRVRSLHKPALPAAPHLLESTPTTPAYDTGNAATWRDADRLVAHVCRCSPAYSRFTFRQQHGARHPTGSSIQTVNVVYAVSNDTKALPPLRRTSGWFVSMTTILPAGPKILPNPLCSSWCSSGCMVITLAASALSKMAA
jgi:hypothetical protein